MGTPSRYKELSLKSKFFFNFVVAKRGHTLIIQRMFILCSPAFAGLLFLSAVLLSAQWKILPDFSQKRTPLHNPRILL